jgi:hypothetical protein
MKDIGKFGFPERAPSALAGNVGSGLDSVEGWYILLVEMGLVSGTKVLSVTCEKTEGGWPHTEVSRQV